MLQGNISIRFNAIHWSFFHPFAYLNFSQAAWRPPKEEMAVAADLAVQWHGGRERGWQKWVVRLNGWNRQKVRENKKEKYYWWWKKESQSILCFPVWLRTSPDRIPLLFLPPMWLQLIKAQHRLWNCFWVDGVRRMICALFLCFNVATCEQIWIPKLCSLMNAMLCL